METATISLQKYFGYSEFRPLQKEIIQSVLTNNDVFVLMPTGGGKSLCYQFPSVIREGLTIVISPLISLMKDQVDSLRANGISAEFINSTLDYSEIDQIRRKLKKGDIDLLYIAPERLMMPNFLEFLENLNISLFAIDEAHCISEWGHDFRPEYRNLTILKEKFPQNNLIALTATATPHVQDDIISQLHLRTPRIFKASFDRPNLEYQVLPKGDTYDQLLNYINKHIDESGIIYCQSRRTVDSLSAQLKFDGIKALPYHAGLSKSERESNQDDFIKDKVDIIVATIAFGMGIDKPNVRYVIHFDLPKNLEGYYQETGRAGRDGLKSDCILFYSYADKAKIEYFITNMSDPKEKNIAHEKLQKMVQYAESKKCRRHILLDYFGEKYQKSNCGSCDNCTIERETFDATLPAQMFLSCVARVSQRFGVNYVIDILKGSKSERLIHNGHNRLTTYGIGSQYTKKEWQEIARNLIDLDYLEIEGGVYPIVKLAEKASGVLYNNEKVQLPVLKKMSTSKKPSSQLEINTELLKELKNLRKQIAMEESVPPYIVFNDVTLQEIAQKIPADWEGLSQITGIGDFKIKKYGPRLLKLIIGFCQKNGITPTSSKVARKPRKMISDTVLMTNNLVTKNKTIKEIAELRSLTESTIVKHIVQLMENGREIDIDQFVTPERRKIIEKALHEVKSDYLVPVKEYLGEEYSFDEIRLVKANMSEKSVSPHAES